MVNIYTDVTELKRLIEDKKIKHERVKSYLKRRGIIFTSSNAATFADQIYTVILGYKEMSDITEMFISDSNYEKSLMLKARTKVPLEDERNIIDYFIDEFSRFRSTTTLYKLEQPIKGEDSDQFSISLSYDKKLPGKNRLIQTEKRSMQFFVRKINDAEVAIDIRQQSSTDTSIALKMLDEISGNEENGEFTLIHINLLSLPSKSNVEFYERLMKRTFKQWSLKTITGITVKKVDSSDEEEETELVDDENPMTDGPLAGINQAALQGQGLQHNEFVKSTLEKGYVISSMRFRYSCTGEAEEFAVVISCKGNDLRIDIDQTYCEEDGRIYKSPFPKDRQDEIIQTFQDTANEINNELRHELSAKSVQIQS